MEETVYTFCGYAYGSFTSEKTGELVNYSNMYCISPIEGEQRADRQFGGYQADKFRCISPEVFEGIAPQDKVHLYFDKRGRVTLAKPVTKAVK